MNSAKNYLIGLLALTTLGGGALAWRQYGELVELRAGALNRTERADQQQRIADLERMNRDLQAQLLAERSDPTAELVAEATRENTGTERSGRERGRGDGPGRGSDAMRQQGAAVRELFAKPEVQALLSQQQKAAIEARYGALFRNLHLTPEQTESLKTLLAERGNTRRDIEEAARAQGIDPRQNPEAYRQLFANAQNELNSSIKSVIGEQGFAQLQQYEQTMPQRNLVENLQLRLAGTNTPLTSSQAEQLVQILAANAPARTTTPTSTDSTSTDRSPGRGPGGPGFGPGPGGIDIGRMMGGGFGGPPPGAGGPTAVVTPNAVAQAQTVLSPAQVTALQTIQQQQQSQQQLQQLVRDAMANAPKSAPTTGTPDSSAKKR